MANTVRGVVHGRISDVKTKYSEDELPLDSAFADVMLDCQKRCPTNDGIGHHTTGALHHISSIQQDSICAAGRHVGLGKDIDDRICTIEQLSPRKSLEAIGMPCLRRFINQKNNETVEKQCTVCSHRPTQLGASTTRQYAGPGMKSTSARTARLRSRRFHWI